MARRSNECQRTWPSEAKTISEDAYRQHRCARATGHNERCRCRYCGASR